MDPAEAQRKIERCVARLNKLKAKKAALKAAQPKQRDDPSVLIAKKDAPITSDANMFDGGVYSHSAPLQCDLCHRLYPLVHVFCPVMYKDGKLVDALLKNAAFEILRDGIRQVVPEDPEFSRDATSKAVSANRFRFASDCFGTHGAHLGCGCGD